MRPLSAFVICRSCNAEDASQQHSHCVRTFISKQHVFAGLMAPHASHREQVKCMGKGSEHFPLMMNRYDNAERTCETQRSSGGTTRARSALTGSTTKHNMKKNDRKHTHICIKLQDSCRRMNITFSLTNKYNFNYIRIRVRIL